MELNAAKSLANDFCEFLKEVPPGKTFNLYNLQGALRWHPGIPAQQTYAGDLSCAVRHAFIERVEGEPDVYRRSTHKFSKQFWKIKEESLKLELVWLRTKPKRNPQ